MFSINNQKKSIFNSLTNLKNKKIIDKESNSNPTFSAIYNQMKKK